jgi:hypothetical protein
MGNYLILMKITKIREGTRVPVVDKTGKYYEKYE